MALSRQKTWVSAEVLTASDLNAEFDNILNNPVSLLSPLVSGLDMDGQTLTIDSDADSTLRATADDLVALRLQGFDAFIFDGDVSTPVNGLTFTSSATGVAPNITAQGTDSNIGITLVPKGTGALTVTLGTGTVAVNGTGAGAIMTLTTTEAGATEGPSLDLYRNSASPANSDVLGAVNFQGEDSAGNTETYAKIRTDIVDVTSASENASLVFQTVEAGTLATRWTVGGTGGGSQIGAPTGGDKGAGTLNVQTAIYLNNQITQQVLQTVNTQTGAVATGTTVMVLDDSIPQITEGDQYMTLAITPKATTNVLHIDVVWVGANSAGAAEAMMVALFQDTTADALAAVVSRVVGASAETTIFLRHKMTAGTTSATTFKVRAGIGSAGTTTFNGNAGARKLGGVMASSITITEYYAT